VRGGESFAGKTVGAARRALAERIKSAYADSAELDARTLAGAALGLDLSGLIAAAARQVTDLESARLEEFAQRRLTGEPVARILGFKEFWGLRLHLSSATLVPRADTETVVELALEIWRSGRHHDRQPRVADLGTGSGAILLALLSELPDVIGVGTDASQAALRTASSNATCLGLASRATFVACNYAAALSGMFDLIVSNAPYIASGDLAGLGREVRYFDPHSALDGGADGLDAYRVLVPQAARLLAPGAALVVEAGIGQSGPIEGLLEAAGLVLEWPARADLAGIPRAVAGRRPPR